MTGPADDAPGPRRLRISDTLAGAAEQATAQLAEIVDPAERALAAEVAIDEANDLRGRMARVRRDAVRELRGIDPATGRPRRSWAEVGALIGVGGGRAEQLARLKGDRTGPRPPHGQGGTP